MPKRARPKPLDEGSLGQIYELFFKPLVQQYSEEEQSADSFMEELFRPDLRPISQWKVVKNFKMPGLYYDAASVKVQGIGYRKMALKTIVMARIDERDETVDIEFFGGPGKKDQVFCLTKLEWEWVKLHLVPEIYDASKPRHRNRVRRKRVRRLDKDKEQEGPGEEGTLRTCA